MWPMPAGTSISQWIAELEHAKFPKEKKWYQRIWPLKKNGKQQKIELLQNEYIYRQQVGDKQSAEVVAAELTKLGGQILASLDKKGASGGTGEGERPIPIPVDDQDERVTPEFARLGSMYEIAGLIWSGVPAQTMHWEAAKKFCKDLGKGSRLPTRKEYDALARVLGYPDDYQPNILPDMDRMTFFSSSTVDLNHVYVFNGSEGSWGWHNHYLWSKSTGRYKDQVQSVRCVRPAA